MKLTYTVEPSVDRPGYLDIRTQMEDEGPLLDTTLSVHHSIFETQIARLSHTVRSWWESIKTKEVNNGG